MGEGHRVCWNCSWCEKGEKRGQGEALKNVRQVAFLWTTAHCLGDNHMHHIIDANSHTGKESELGR